MPVERRTQKRSAKPRVLPLHDEFVRQTEEQLVLVRELTELARELCAAAGELRKITQELTIPRPTVN